LDLAYAPIEIKVSIFRDAALKPNFRKTEFLFVVAKEIREFVQSKPVQTVLVDGTVSYDGADAALAFQFENGKLVLQNVCGLLCETLERDISLIKKCLAKMDYSKPFSEKCTSLD
jgi:hypothetical protein